MNTTILSSTFFLTLLLAVGLFFFIRASIKDRTEQVKLIVTEPEESLLARLQEYFDRRSYRIAALDRATGEVTFGGVGTLDQQQSTVVTLHRIHIGLGLEGLGAPFVL